MQPEIASHAVQTRLLPLVQAVLSYIPGPQAAVQVAQVSAVPSTRYVPLPQVVHCWSVLFVHVTPEVHPLIGVHAVHTRSPVLVQAALS